MLNILSWVNVNFWLGYLEKGFLRKIQPHLSAAAAGRQEFLFWLLIFKHTFGNCSLFGLFDRHWLENSSFLSGLEAKVQILSVKNIPQGVSIAFKFDSCQSTPSLWSWWRILIDKSQLEDHLLEHTTLYKSLSLRNWSMSSMNTSHFLLCSVPGWGKNLSFVAISLW